MFFKGMYMDTTYSSFEYLKSVSRIDEILNSSDFNYTEKDSVPSRDLLTFTNGFYVNCAAMFIDIRGSKELSEKYKRTTLARYYRCYISELISVMRNHPDVCEINVQGDCVWGIFNTTTKTDINGLFSIAAQASSFIDIFNWKLEKKELDILKVGIGLSYGRALMIKAGYKGSTVNEVVWMGDVVNEASKLCSYGSRGWTDERAMVSEVFFNNLNDHNKTLLAWNYSRECYHGYFVNIEMNNWLESQKAR
jgi:class 3 adenylate cyclase